MRKKGFLGLILLSLAVLSSFVFAVPGYVGNVTISNSSGNNLTAEQGAVIDAYVNGLWKANTTVKAISTYPNGYYIIGTAGSSGDNLFFKVWGQNASPSLSLIDGINFLNLTMVSAPNAAACTFSKGCNGGYCCNGATELSGRALSGGTCQATACSTPPVLNGSTQSATSVTAGEVVTFNVNVTDASNSISNTTAELENPSGTKTNYSMTLAAGTNGAGNTLRYELNFTTVSPTGTWYAKFYANDTSGNIGNTTDRNLTFTVLSSSPVLNGSTQSATSVTVGGVVTFNVNVTDASTNISNTTAELENPSGTKTNYSMTLAAGTNGAGNTLRYELNFTTISPTGTWYAKFYANDTSGNIGNTTDRNLTFTVSAASSSSSSGGGGGSSGGGGGGGTGSVSETSSLTGTTSSGSTASFAMTKAADTGISAIEVSTAAAVTNPQITVKQTTLGTGQSTAISSSSGSTYQYLTITKTNIKDTDINSAKVKFQVTKKWATDNSIDPKTVALTKYISNAWVKQTTTYVKEDSTYYYYEASVAGFSLFAITGEKKVTYTALEIIDIIRNFYAGKSTYTALNIIDIIRKFYAGG